MAALIAIACVLGLLFGSFLNVCIARLPKDESVATPRSRCPHCGHTIRWYDNLPVLSWLFLRGRCRDCRAGISLQYPLVELALAAWFAFCIASYPDVQDKILGCTLGFLLLGLMVMDWQTQLLPDTFTIPGILLGFLLTCTRAIFLAPGQDQVLLQRKININSAGAGRDQGNIFLTGPEHLIFGRLFAICGAFLLLFAIRALYRTLRKREGLGLGDAKLLAMIAAFLGFAPTLVALFAGILLATVYAVGLLLRRRAGAATRLPLGSFLCVGGFFAMLFGQPIVDWYLTLLR